MSNNPAGQKVICQHCKKKFIPDYRNRHHQKYCNKPACRRASKLHSQKNWLSKNPGFFKGHEHVLRVQVWRQEKGRSRGRMIYKLVIEFIIFRRKGRQDRVEVTKKDAGGMVLQDVCELKSTINTQVILRLVKVLQDFTDLLLPKAYSPVKKGRKARNGGKGKCRRLRESHQACLRRSRNSIIRR